MQHELEAYRTNKYGLVLDSDASLPVELSIKVFTNSNLPDSLLTWPNGWSNNAYALRIGDPKRVRFSITMPEQAVQPYLKATEIEWEWNGHFFKRILDSPNKQY